MNTKKINTYFLLAISFLAAALGSTLISLLCMGAIIFLCQDKSLAGQSAEAVVLSFAAPLFSSAMDVVRTLLGLFPSNVIFSMIHDIIRIATGLVDLAVFIVGIIAAMKVMKKEKANIPLISGKFDGIISED